MSASTPKSDSAKSIAWKFPNFPNSLIFVHNAKQEVPLYQVERLRFQYNLMTSSHSPLIVQQTSRNFFHTCKKEKINIPSGILEQFCNFCHCFLLPGITCTQRLRSRSLKSKVNNVGKSHVKNELVLMCTRCNRKGKVKRAYQCVEKRAKKQETPEEIKRTDNQKGQPLNNLNTVKPKLLPNLSKPLNDGPKPKFSFLGNMQQSNGSKTSNNSSTGGFNFLKNNATVVSKPISSLQNNSNTSIVGLPNLLEIERLKKLEKRRKSM